MTTKNEEATTERAECVDRTRETPWPPEEGTGPVTAEEALEIAQRFIDRHFDNVGEMPRISIPADPKRDDDIRLVAFIEQSAAAVAERDRLRREVEKLRDEAREHIRTVRRVEEVEAFARRLDVILTEGAS